MISRPLGVVVHVGAGGDAGAVLAGGGALRLDAGAAFCTGTSDGAHANKNKKSARDIHERLPSPCQ